MEQLKQGEGQTSEFKMTFQKEVIETIVSFANAKGGRVYIGVNDRGDIIGVKLNKESLQNWVNQIKQATSPSVIPDVDTAIVEGKTIVVMEVKEYPIKPVSVKHRYLVRKANANHIMSMDEIANEYLKTKNSSWDYYSDSQHNFRDISLKKIENAVRKIEKILINRLMIRRYRFCINMAWFGTTKSPLALIYCLHKIFAHSAEYRLVASKPQRISSTVFPLIAICLRKLKN
nr:ATP-binding protein [Methylomarinum sp. Ch1-1]MDP4521087.1 ATP-binding protein [Methylomarinum sp. Ch1-1]